MFANSDDAFSYLEAFTNFERRNTKLREYRLDRMKQLLTAFGNPERSFKPVHIAGSKGKGTTAILCASALSAAGCKTGLYMSPHVLDYRERITLAGSFFDEKTYIDHISTIRAYLENGAGSALPGDEEPTTFELLTLLAFMIFRSSGCEYAVIETGLGGRLDATNLVVPLVSVITSIELEHCSVLGNTISEIAGEKAGIIKHEVPVVCSAEHPDAVQVIRSKALEMNSRFIRVSDLYSADVRDNLDFSAEINLSLRTSDGISGRTISYTSSFTGKYSALNAASAALALNIALPGISDSALAAGFTAARLKGRNEIWENGSVFIFDAAHTPASVSSLMESVKARYPGGGILVFALARDKNPLAIVPFLCDWPDEIIITRPGFFKESAPEAVYDAFSAKYAKSLELISHPADALRHALASGKSPVLVTGSFYLIACIQKEILMNRDSYFGDRS